jgi:catechol 2,3-dioxygenase-like lactoylglutathione lyase family enzyme
VFDCTARGHTYPDCIIATCEYDFQEGQGAFAPERVPQWSIAAMIESISAITLATHNMSRAVYFYRMLGFEIVYGGDDASFTSFRAGTNYLNLIAQPTERNWSWWGRVIFYHSDVDSLHASVVAAGYRPDTAPHNAEWGERFFHLTDPDGHELSFAWPLR